MVKFGFIIPKKMKEHIAEREGPFRVEMLGYAMDYELDKHGGMQITRFELKDVRLVDMAMRPGEEETLAPDKGDRSTGGEARRTDPRGQDTGL